MSGAAPSVTMQSWVSRYIVQPGDTLSSIAEANGLFWRTIWEHAENEALRQKRAHPEILSPGDELFVPERRARTVSIATGRSHVFRRRGVPVQVRFELRTPGGEELTGRRYRLQSGDQIRSGVSGAGGRIEEWMAPSTRMATLTVWLDDPRFPPSLEWELQVGDLNPANTLEGARQRLRNLHYDCGGESGDEPGPGTRAALEAFQRANGLSPSGALDDDTAAQLATVHGS